MVTGRKTLTVFLNCNCIRISRIRNNIDALILPIAKRILLFGFDETRSSEFILTINSSIKQEI